MSKKKNIVIFLFLILLVLSGCSVSTQSNSGESNSTQAGETNPPGAGNADRIPDNFEEAGQADLAIGKYVSVFGTENSDGSLMAERIMLADNKTDLENLGNNFMRGAESANSGGDNNGATNSEGANNNRPGSASAGGQNPNFERFQNMTQAERDQLREEMSARGENAARTNYRSGIVRLLGEIIAKDDISFTVSLTEGGSRLVFISGESAILKAK